MLGGHAWVLVFLPNKGVILVDPSTKLVSDNPEDLQTVKDANYTQLVVLDIEAQSKNGEKLDAINQTRYLSALLTTLEAQISLQDPKMQETGGWGSPKMPPERSEFNPNLVKLVVGPNPSSYLEDNYNQKISNLRKI